jgi:pyruvate dehydrogenase (quinone)
VLTVRQELSVPPHVTFSEMKGVSLFAGRMILSGRGDELVELARENVPHRPAGKRNDTSASA